MVFNPRGIATMTPRQTGRTTAQMKRLPKGGLFIWCVNALNYPQKLAQFIERPDIKIVRPCWVMGQNWKGFNFSGVELDHAYHEHNSRNSIFNGYIDEIKARIKNDS